MMARSGTESAGDVSVRSAWVLPAMIGAVVVVGTLAVLALQTDNTGQYHDDAVYTVVAKSLAEGDGYRIASLPTAPAQTKYPPLYSHLLSWVWRAAPSFPENVLWLKLTSVAFLAGVAALGGAFYGRYSGRLDLGGAVFILLVGANMLVFPFVDYTLTELPFALLCMAALVVADPRRSSTSGRQAALLGLVVGLAFLVRQAALPLFIAGLVYLLPGRRPRQLVLYVGIAVLVAAPWLVFKFANAGTPANPLLQYYLAYEKSVPALAFDDPGHAAQIVLANIVYLGYTIDVGLFLPFAPGLRPFVYPLVLLGLWRIFRRPPRFLTVFAPLYLTLMLLWPWQPTRYSIPLVPVLLLAFTLGTRAAIEGLRPLVSQALPRRVLQGFVALPLVAVLTINSAWMVNFLRPVPGKTRVAYAARLDYSWEGFEETFAWIREHTEADAVLASAYDPIYYLYTGRQGVRPWFHRPETYFYPLGGGEPRMGPADVARRALTELGVGYMVIDPIDGYVEGDAARELMEEILAGYAQPPVLAYTSTDGLHRVYRLPSRGGE